MKKLSLFLLPLVAVLASCGSGKADIFTKVRSEKISSTVKSQVVSSFGRYVAESIITIQEQKQIKQDGIWKVSEVVTAKTWSTKGFYYANGNNVFSLDLCASATYDPTTALLQFKLDKVSGAWKVTLGSGAVGQFNLDGDEVYDLVSGSPLRWKTSFFAGVHFYLCASNPESFMPKEVLKKLTNSYAIVGSSKANFSIAGGDSTLECDKGSLTYSINNFKMAYRNYRLENYVVGANISQLTSATERNTTNIVVATSYTYM